ncbi:MAG: hypothetical protein J3Q66DRAFT_413380 [Benniella sp.]|nr:MAG: hypothetical protein J3Q66DRAFT_413380 [Benniella sp.]
MTGFLRFEIADKLESESFFEELVTEPFQSICAAPTTVPIVEGNQHIESHPSSENTIRSIGFRDCSPYPLIQSNKAIGDNGINLSTLAIIYDGQSNTVSLRADGSTEHEFDATTDLQGRRGERPRGWPGIQKASAREHGISAHIPLTAYDRVVYDQTIELAKAAPLIPRALSFVRVLNILMLAVLVEGTVVSTVSRTVLGVVIAGTQALMMLVLACLIFYQLGKVLWQLCSALRSRRQAKKHKKTGGLEPLDNEEVLVISVKDEEKYKDDSNGKDKDDEPQGRMASEHFLVGMMGIGSNPKIQCTPASDEEDNDLDIDDGDYLGEMVSGRSQSRGTYNSPGIQCGSTARIRDNLRNALRDSNGVNGRSSLIPNHCNPAYIPSNLQAKAPRNQPESGTEQDNETSRTLRKVSARARQLLMFRTSERRPRSHRHLRMATDVILAKGDNEVHLDKYLQQRRRRPFSLGAARQGPVPSTFSTSLSESRQRASRTKLGSGRDVFPTFRGIYIPESLLAGPPPPSTQPRRTSVTSATLVTSPSLSPVLNRASGDFETMFSTPPDPLVFAEGGSEQGSVMSTPTEPLQPIGIPYFEEYRFPDEERPRVVSGAHGSIRQPPGPTQWTIHPLSPLHLDYQHPDDLYRPAMPSPNEEGPAYTSVSSLATDATQTSLMYPRMAGTRVVRVGR